MKGIKSGQEWGETPPAGRYKVRLEKVEAGFAKSSGNPQLNIVGEIIDHPQYAGRQFYHNVLTDGTKGGKHVTFLKQLLGARAETDEEIPDAIIAQELLGLELFADLTHEPRMNLGPSGKYDVPVTEVVNGVQKPVMNLRVSGYFRSNAAATTATAPQFQANVPTTGTRAHPMQIVDQTTPAVAAAPQFQIPPGWQLVNGQLVPLTAPVPTQVAPPQFNPQYQPVPPGFQPGAFPPGAFPPGAFPPGATPPWNGAAAPTPDAATLAAQTETEGGGRGKRKGVKA